MASVRQYGYYIKGNKVAIVEKDTAFDNDANSRDYGPGSNRAQWKSPLATITDGIEVQYVYSPEYYINDADDTKAISAYAESGGLLWFTVASMSATAGDWILIKGSDRWNGLHQVNATISGATAIVTKTKYNGDAVTESSTLYQDIDVLNDEDDIIQVSSYLSKALVYYVKAKVAEDMMNIEAKQYFMREFRKMVEKYNNTRVAGLRIQAAGPHAIR